jgi:hypothetical protein
MNGVSRTGVWMGAAFCAALAVAIFALAIRGAGSEGTALALRLTARVSFLLFWLAYAGNAIAALFGPPFAILARRGRDFGLAFASAQLVHVGLIVWLASISTAQDPLDAVMPFFAIGIVWTYLLAFSSMTCVRNAFSPYLLSALRTVGVEYIALVYFVDFIVGPSHPLQRPFQYVPFWVLILSGPLLRLAATIRGAYKSQRATFG